MKNLRSRRSKYCVWFRNDQGPSVPLQNFSALSQLVKEVMMGNVRIAITKPPAPHCTRLTRKKLVFRLKFPLKNCAPPGTPQPGAKRDTHVCRVVKEPNGGLICTISRGLAHLVLPSTFFMICARLRVQKILRRVPNFYIRKNKISYSRPRSDLLDRDERSSKRRKMTVHNENSWLVSEP